jgi:hypothetical protein
VALDSRRSAYERALSELSSVEGWARVAEEQREWIARPLRACLARIEPAAPVTQLRADTDACESRLRKAVADLHRAAEGERLVTLSLATYFASGIEAEEQLDAALEGIREECARLIGAGKKVIVQ